MLGAKHTHKCTHSLSYMFRCPTMFLPPVLLTGHNPYVSAYLPLAYFSPAQRSARSRQETRKDVKYHRLDTWKWEKKPCKCSAAGDRPGEPVCMSGLGLYIAYAVIGKSYYLKYSLVIIKFITIKYREYCICKCVFKVCQQGSISSTTYSALFICFEGTFTPDPEQKSSLAWLGKVEPLSYCATP